MIFIKWKNREIKESKCKEPMDIKNLRWRERIRDNRKTKEVLGSVAGNVKYFRSWGNSE